MKIIVACSYFRHDNNNDGDRDNNNLNDGDIMINDARFT